VKPDTKTETEELLERILHLSWHISVFSPPMKPFIRFSTYGKERVFGNVTCSRFFWDFDDLLQKKLLGLVYEIASPDTIVQAGIERWKSNLETLYRDQKRALERAMHDGTGYAFHFQPRIRLIVEGMGPGSRLLYVGCGSGSECLHFAKRGLCVVGIDTMAPLLDIARGWATHLKLPADFICMDVMSLGFEPGSFDSFLLEFYGSQVPSQTLTLQRSLASILHPEGQGFIVARRKRYSSYWFRMGSPCPPAMTGWLAHYAKADFLFSEADGCEERLLYGLYNRAHTTQSLSSELSHTFEVAECFYEQDPRYVMAVVRHKEEEKPHEETGKDQPKPAKVSSPSSLSEITNTLRKMETLCDQLENHTEKVIACFQEAENSAAENCLKAMFVSPDVSRFMVLLEDLFDPEQTQGQAH